MLVQFKTKLFSNLTYVTFFFFEIRSLYVVLLVLELATLIRLSSNSKRSACLGLSITFCHSSAWVNTPSYDLLFIRHNLFFFPYNLKPAVAGSAVYLCWCYSIILFGDWWIWGKCRMQKIFQDLHFSFISRPNSSTLPTIPSPTCSPEL